MRDPYAPVRGKCTWWREVPNPNDVYDSRLKEPEKRVDCTCFVVGSVWSYRTCDVPAECPDSLHCRYYIKGG